MSVLWMKITKDKFELPLVVADTIVELSRLCGVDVSVISRSAKSNRERPEYRGQYVKVEIDEVD